MAITRVTQSMMMNRSLGSLQTSLSRLAVTQEQLSTGRVINRPSDSPTGAISAMRLRASLSDQNQYARNADDALGWLTQVDSALASMSGQVGRVRDLALQGANSGATGPTARAALAAEIDQVRQGLISTANTAYLGRPIFGGVTTGPVAYDSAGTYVGTPGTVNRTVADGTRISVTVDAQSVLGPTGTSVLDELTALSTALRAGDTAGIQAGLGAMTAALGRITSAQADVGTRTHQVEQASRRAEDTVLQLTTSLSEIENTDLPRATVDLKMQEMAYQAALAATARVLQPSLQDFLR